MNPTKKNIASMRTGLSLPQIVFSPTPVRDKAPKCMIFEAWGKMIDSRTFSKNATQQGNIKYAGGTVIGGVVILPPEVCIQDIGTSFIVPGVTNSDTYFGVAGGAAFFAGIPYNITGGLTLGYSWLADSFGVLTFRKHDAFAVRRDAIRFTDLERIGLRALTDYWGDFTHSITANRVWTMPDATGRVLVTADADGILTAGSIPYADTNGLLTESNQDLSVQLANTTSTDGTQKTLQTITLTASNTYLIEVKVYARRTGGSSGTDEDGAAYVIHGAFKMVAGVATLIGSLNADFTAEDQAGWDATLDVTGATVRVRVTGAANNNISWRSIATISRVSS